MFLNHIFVSLSLSLCVSLCLSLCRSLSLPVSLPVSLCLSLSVYVPHEEEEEEDLWAWERPHILLSVSELKLTKLQQRTKQQRWATSSRHGHGTHYTSLTRRGHEIPKEIPKPVMRAHLSRVRKARVLPPQVRYLVSFACTIALFCLYSRRKPASFPRGAHIPQKKAKICWIVALYTKYKV